MKKEGVDINNEEEVKKFHDKEKAITIEGIREIFFKYCPNGTIYFNTGGAEINLPQWHDYNTHFELEDLPTVWGGYDKLPIRAKYFGGTGKDYLAMTGKFHCCWGEFGGFKTTDALKFEVSSMLTWGSKCSIGDQMHPLGTMDLQTYKNIGEAYSYAEKIEEYCFGVKETSKLAVMVNTNAKVNEGIAKLLLDCHFDFDIIHQNTNLNKYEVILIPDNYYLNETDAKRIQEFVDNKGKLLILGGGALREDKSQFAINIGLEYLGKSEFDKDYIKIESILDSPLLCYSSAHKVKGNGEILATVFEPYFKRTYKHYCSHSNTPNKAETANYPGCIKVNNVIYIAHELASNYFDFGNIYQRRYFEKIVNLLYTDKNIVASNLQPTARIRFVEQEKKHCYCAHFLYAPPIQRGSVAIIDDLPPLYNIETEVKVDKPIKSVKLMPQNENLAFEQENNKVSFTVEKFTSHQLVVLEY